MARSQVAEQASHVGHTGEHQGDDQHRVHRTGSENRPQSMNETRARSPKVCFSRDSYLVYEGRRDSRKDFWPRSVTLRCEPTGPARSGRPDEKLREPRRATALADSSFEARHTNRLLPTCALLVADLGNIRDRWRAPQDDGEGVGRGLGAFRALARPTLAEAGRLRGVDSSRRKPSRARRRSCRLPPSPPDGAQVRLLG